MEKATNDNVIGSLYTLRAGLSLVAQEKEAFEREVSIAKARKAEERREFDRKINQENENLKREQDRLTQINKERDDCARKAGKDALQDRNMNLFAIWSLVVLLIVCIVATVICFVNMSNGIIYTMLAALLCNVDFFGGIGFIFIIKFKVDDLHYCLKPIEHKDAINKLPILDMNINSVRNSIEAKYKRLSDIKAEFNKQEIKTNIEYEKECEKAKKHVSAASEIIKALEETYCYLIDIRDWENLDLIIYSLETRRADNIKEALQIVDNERRANRIVEAVSQASKEICRSVNAGLSSLRNEMNLKFCALSQQITLHTALLSDQMAEIANETNINRALLAQANKSSAQLAGYAEQIRDNTKYIASHI